jgi:hypothetical protein
MKYLETARQYENAIEYFIDKNPNKIEYKNPISGATIKHFDTLSSKLRSSESVMVCERCYTMYTLMSQVEREREQHQQQKVLNKLH